jgi:hypothetical protein
MAIDEIEDGETGLSARTKINESFTQLDDKLDSVTLVPQTVAGAVEFLQDITVPSTSVILGKDGARVGSAGRSLSFTDARERNTLFSQYSYTDAGGDQLYYWDIGPLQEFNICPDSNASLPSPQELAFSGAGGNSLTRGFNIIPLSAGTLRVQAWEGPDDTGAVLTDNYYEITGPQLASASPIPLPAGQISETGDSQFVRFSGIQLAGSLSQSSGLFVGQEAPFLDTEVHVLTKVLIPSQTELDSKLDIVTTDSTLSGSGTSGDPLGVSVEALGCIKVMGFWNADTNTPDLSALTPAQGDSYQVSVAGSTNLNGETNWGTRDLAVWDDSLSGNWFKLNSADDVISVNSKVGAVVLNTADIGLGNVDNTSDANKPVSLSQQTALDLKANLNGATIVNATYNGVAITAAGFAGFYLDSTGNYAQAFASQVINNSSVTGAFVSQALDNLDAKITSTFGELRRSTNGNQSIGTTPSRLAFNLVGVKAGTNISTINSSIEVINDGAYRVSLTGSAILKRDAVYTIYVRTNSDSGTDTAIVCAEIPEDNYCWALSGSIILDLEIGDKVELWATCSGTKDFKMQVGTGFSVVEL